jgi:23S rRNA pseudouridine1911/1915/1917 synthase
MNDQEGLRPELLYLDNHLLALNKPSGLATHEDGVHEQTLRLWAEKYLAHTLNKPGRAFVVPVHRLDKMTSGVVLFAKTDKALKRMMEAFRSRKVYKHYKVCVEGGFQSSSGRWEDGLIRKESQSFIVSKDQEGAQLAILEYRLRSREKGYSFCDVDLYTGRHHQIRAQFASRGYPVVGDRKYGSQRDLGARLMLHHARLEVPHPITGSMLSFEAPLPDFWPDFCKS